MVVMKSYVRAKATQAITRQETGDSRGADQLWRHGQLRGDGRVHSMRMHLWRAGIEEEEKEEAAKRNSE